MKRILLTAVALIAFGGAMNVAAQVQAQDGVTLRFVARASTNNENAFRPLLEEFEAANPGIKVEFQTIPYDQFTQTMTTRIIGGSAPDVAYVLDRWANAFAGQGALASLDDRVPQEYIDTLTDFHWSEFATPAGEHFGVPLTFNIQALIVNKTALDAAGVDIPATFEEGWSWNELIDVGRKIKQSGVTEFAFNYWYSSTPSRLSQYLVAEGGSILTPDLSAANLDTPVARRVLAEIQKTFEDGLAPPDNWTAVKQMFPLFLSGKVAIQMAGGNYSIPAIRQGDPNFEWLYAPMPTTLGTANPLVMFNQTEHPDEAWRLMEFLMKPENVLKLSSVSFNLPARQDLEVEQLQAAFGEDAAKMQFLIQEQTKGITQTILNEMAHQGWSEIDLYMRGKLEELALGRKTPDELVAEATIEINRILAKYN